MARSVENVYADALLSAAKESGKTEEILKDAELLLKTLHEAPEFLMCLSDPGRSKEDRENAFLSVFSDVLQNETSGFLSVIIEKRREDRLEEILNRFIRLAEASMGIGRVSVRTAFPVTEKEKAAIEEKVRQTAGYQTLYFNYETDESLIGGLVIRLGDRVVDGSVKNRLDKLTRELLKTRVE